MSESFRVSGTDINVRASIQMMKLAVVNRAQFDHHVGNSEIAQQIGRDLWIVRPRIRASRQLAGQKKFDRPASRTIGQERERADQCLKVPIIVIVADEKKSHRTVSRSQLVFDFGRKRRGIAKKLIPVKPMMNRPYLPADVLFPGPGA